jgi:hypothetical protein
MMMSPMWQLPVGRSEREKKEERRIERKGKKIER